MQSLLKIATNTLSQSQHLSRTLTISAVDFKSLSTKPSPPPRKGDDEWNDAWETAWLPPDPSSESTRAPWETEDASSPSSAEFSGVGVELSSDVDPETKAFVEDMNENWDERRKPKEEKKKKKSENESESGSLYSLENIKKDYRLKKQRIHAGLWMKEIEKQQEAKLGSDGGDDIERLLDSCSDIFDTNNDSEDMEVPSGDDFKNKPDGWETTAKAQEGSVWEMTQKEEDILLQEFERRIAYNKFQIASFIKTHIFSRRRPIDGWKYMIEELGPNARKGKGAVSRSPNLSDASTQPFKEDRNTISSSSLTSYKNR